MSPHVVPDIIVDDFSILARELARVSRISEAEARAAVDEFRAMLDAAAQQHSGWRDRGREDFGRLSPEQAAEALPGVVRDATDHGDADVRQWARGWLDGWRAATSPRPSAPTPTPRPG